MTTKTIDSRGRVLLGAEYAGQLVLVEETADRIVIQKATAIPQREAWLYENEKALNLVRQGLDQALAGQFSAAPPDLDADAALVANLAD